MNRTWLRRAGLIPAASLLAIASAATAAPPRQDVPADDRIAAASDDGRDAISRFKIPRGFRVDLVAAEPLLANPVAFTLDEKGRLYVAETFRLHHGVTDNRGHMSWLDDDLAARTVDDRVAMYRKHLGEEARTYAEAEDRVRRLVDSDGDGVYDHATVFADGFRDMADGLGSGLLARGDTVWYANIPHLWKFVDRDGDGVAEVREALSSGYGVHVAFLGHDLHGLILGPDGRLYFSVGDRGLNVKTKEGKQLTVLAQGAILRCEPDGSGLEVFATGLRNPQELAFDPYGNLFTVDNNSDGGDRARLVDLVDGGDSGWRMGYQYIEAPNLRGPWNAENLWKPRAEGNEAASQLPTLINVADGPSGLTRDAGTGLPEKYRDHFFLADFRGTAGSSGIRSFALEPEGATFKMVDQEQFLWSVLATDVALAPNGGLLVSDWTEGWELPRKGRMYRVSPEVDFDATAAGEVTRLLADGMAKRTIDELGRLLAHADYRVRLEAHLELASRALSPRATDAQKAEAVAALTYASRQPASLFGRLHAIWALGRVARLGGDASALSPVADRLQDHDGHVRAQAASVLGESGRADLAPRIAELLDDPDPRVRLRAAIALGKLGDPGTARAIAEMVVDSDDKDAYLRHAGVMGLMGTADPRTLDGYRGSRSAALRLATVVVHRRRGDAAVARFLTDPMPNVALEAARAIYDAGIADAMPALAALEPKPKTMGEPMLRRIVAANERVGGDESARRLASMAGRDDLPVAIRAEALDALGGWASPSGRDRIVGLWRPIPGRPTDPAANALRGVAATILGKGPDELRQASSRAVGRLGLADQSGSLLSIVKGDAGADAKVSALEALESLKSPALGDAVEVSIASKEDRLRSEGLRLLAAVDPTRALPLLTGVLDSGTSRERQAALAALGAMKSNEADDVLVTWLDQLNDGSVPPALRLDLIESAAGRDTPAIRERLEKYEATRNPESQLAAFRESIEGGDARRGARIFFDRTEAQCLKCHKAYGRGGEVGPDLAGIGGRKDRAYFLQSIVEPNTEIAQGFDTLVVATADGQVRSGIVKDDKGDVLRLMDAEGKILEIPKADIEEQKRGLSAMPTDLLKNLSRRDVRDLVEFLSGLK